MHNLDGSPCGGFKINTMPLGAGGFVTSWDQAQDGSYAVHGTDVAMCYIRELSPLASQWRLLITPTSMPSGYVTPNNNSMGDSGCAALRISRSNPNRIFLSWQSYSFISDDKGVTFRVCTSLGQKYGYGNTGAQRRFASFASDIHPTNPDIIVYGTYRGPSGSTEDTTKEGVFYTQNGGTSWSRVSGLPRAIMMDNNGAPGRYLVRFDHTTPTNVYIHVPGSGLYRSTTGITGSFSLIASTPLKTSCIRINNGDVWLTSFRDNGGPPTNDLFKVASGTTTVTSYACGISGIDQFDIDPNNSNLIIGGNENGGMCISRDGAATWTNVSSTRGDGEIAWISNTDKGRYFANIKFDRTIANKIWCTDGVGVSNTTTPTVGGSILWHDQSQGNEELIVTRINTFATISAPFVNCWDKPIWKLKNLDKWTNNFTYPTVGGAPRDVGTVTIGYGVDQAIDDANYLVGLVGQGATINGYSTDAGETFTQFDSTKFPAAVLAEQSNGGRPGGCVAVSNKTNIIITPANNGTAYYTKDGAATWNTVKLDGVNAVSGWNNAYYTPRFNVTADKQRPGVFACYYTVQPPTVATVAATANLALSGGTAFPVVDGYQTQLGDLVVLRLQTSTAQNGVYVVGGTSTAWTLTRHPEYDTYIKLQNNGTQLGGAGATIQWGGFQFTAPNGGTLGTSAITVTRQTPVYRYGGMWVTTDGGDTWTRTISGLIDTLGTADNRQFWAGQLEYVPGFSGELLYCGHSDQGPDSLVWIKNDGATRQDMRSTVRDVSSFGFGAPFPGQTRPSVLFAGKVNGVAGTYFSYDWFATDPILVERYVQNSVNGIGSTAMSKHKFGIGLAASGGAPGSVYRWGVQGRGKAA
ncbi:MULTISPECIES: hypothetical protein [Sphingomonas]|uniref:hypothetical protein n=1 Tax=Sphingomonas TaxID=13687 RepID=UPI000DEFB9B2|nr:MULTISPECIES: hypothetical protein [Sphingomonas]